MGRTQNLRHNVINQFIDSIKRGYISSPLPSQSMLAEMYNISRTTVRHTMEYLCGKGIIEQVGDTYVIKRQPEESDKFHDIIEPKLTQQKQFEDLFYQMIDQRLLKPGDSFTELQLSRSASVSPVAVREFLLRFSRYGLINNIHRGQWQMVKLDRHYAENLFELREILETHALNKFMNLPQEDPRWTRAKDLLLRHRELRETVNFQYRAFSRLDHDLHELILSAADNPFFDQHFELISVIFHFQYQWGERDLKERNVLGIEEHMAILSAMITHNDLTAMNELRRHLDTAKRTMINSMAYSHF